MPELSQQELDRVGTFLTQDTVRRRNLFRFTDDLKLLAKAGFELLCVDDQATVSYGVMAWKVVKNIEQSVYLAIRVQDFRRGLGRDDEFSRLIEQAFQSGVGRQRWLEAIRVAALAGAQEETPLLPRTCWERILDDNACA